MFKEKLAKLIDVKTIVTLSVLASTIVLALKGAIPADKIYDMCFLIVGFFFGVKKANGDAK